MKDIGAFVMFELIIKGLIIGLLFGVPAGAIGALTIQRTIERGFLPGFLTGMGSSVADTIFATIGVLGVTLISDFLRLYEKPITIVGAGLIVLYGIIIFQKKSITAHENQRSELVYIRCFFSAFLIAISNPATLAAFLVVFPTLGIIGPYSMAESIMLIVGVTIGTVLWWTLLCCVMGLFHKRITDDKFKKVNHVLGTLMIAFGFVMFIKNFWD